MSLDESEQLRIKQFQNEITEIAERYGITNDAAFPRWICENFLGIEDEGKILDIPTKNIDLNIPAIPACLKLHNIDVIVRIRTLKDKDIN